MFYSHIISALISYSSVTQSDLHLLNPNQFRRSKTWWLISTILVEGISIQDIWTQVSNRIKSINISKNSHNHRNKCDKQTNKNEINYWIRVSFAAMWDTPLPITSRLLYWTNITYTQRGFKRKESEERVRVRSERECGERERSERARVRIERAIRETSSGEV